MQPSTQMRLLLLLLLMMVNTCATTEEEEQNFPMFASLQKQLKVKQLIDNANSTNADRYLDETETKERTFGRLRPLKLAIPAIMYKLGVMTTMIGFLTLVAVKGLFVGLTILIIQLSAGFAKLFSLKKDHHESWDHEGPWQGKPPQNIHVHVHGAGAAGHSHYKSAHSAFPYSAWAKNDLVNTKIEDDYLQKLKLNSRLEDDYIQRLKLNTRIEDDYWQRLQELKELRELRESLYSQVI